MKAKTVITSVLIGVLVLGVALHMAWSDTTYTAPSSVTTRSGGSGSRYRAPERGLMVVRHTTDDINDVTEALTDPGGRTDISGYLQRVVFSSDGNDGTWSLSITDANGATLFARTDCNMVNDPCSYVFNAGAGVPFVGGLNLVIADANDGDGNDIDVILLIEEVWRR